MPWILTVVLGGFINSSAAILWGVLAPVAALVFTTGGTAPRWFAAYFALVVLTALVQPLSGPSGNDLPPWLITAFFIMNIGAPSAVVFLLLHHFVRQLRHLNREMGRLSSFPELNPAAIVEMDVSGRISYFNPAAARLFPEVAQGVFPLLPDVASVARRSSRRTARITFARSSSATSGTSRCCSWS